MRTKLTLLVVLSFICSYSWAQLDAPASSPSAKLTQTVGLTEVTIEYSRPSARGRDIFGGLVPFGELWRTGANAATTISFDKEVTFGDTQLDPGSYAILTKPGKDEWTLNLYPKKENGFPAYLDRTPSASVTAKPVETSPAMETFSLTVNNLKSGSAHLVIQWANTQVNFKFEVATKEAVMAQIDRLDQTVNATMANNYFGAASYLLSEKQDMDKALTFINKAVEMRPTAFWMSRTKSLIQAEMNDYKGALKTAEKSLADAKSANNGDYIRMNEASIAEWKKK